MAVTLALFAAGIALGVAGACVWAWGVSTGQFRDLERTKDQLFWPDLAPGETGSDERGDDRGTKAEEGR